MTPSAFSLKKRTALVTGSSRGIGRAILRALAEAGANVIAHGMQASKANLDEIKDLEQFGGSVDFVAGDLSAPSGGRRVAEEVLDLVGGVDIVILNASHQIRKPWDEITPSDFEQQMRTNLLASLEIIQVLAPAMKAQKWGRIVSIGSVQEVKPHPEMAIYAASKAGQGNLVINLAKQLAPDGITVNNIAPGVIATDRNTEALSDDSYAEKVRAAIPAGIFGEPRDCAGATLLLCSEAGRYITGQSLIIDGGMSL